MGYQPPPLNPQGPGGFGSAAGGGYQPVPQTYLVWSILNLIFCCLPFGIVALIYSIQCQSAINGGLRVNAMGMSEADRTSQLARKWNIAATSIGAAVIVIYLIVVFGVISSVHTGNQP